MSERAAQQRVAVPFCCFNAAREDVTAALLEELSHLADDGAFAGQRLCATSKMAEAVKWLGGRVRRSVGTAFEHGLGLVPTRARGGLVRMFLRAVPRGARSSVAERAAPALEPDAYLPVLTGPLRGAKWSVHSSLHGCFAGDYEPETQRALERHIAPGSVVFDVGANVGSLSLLAVRLARLIGRVVAFEPAPVAVAYLRRHIALDGADNVVIAVAAGDRNGRTRFSSVGPVEMGHLADGGDLEVETASLDTLVEAGIIPSPDIVKIDIEGAELAVLRGARAIMRARRPVVVLSTHGPRVSRGVLLTPALPELHRDVVRALAREH